MVVVEPNWGGVSRRRPLQLLHLGAQPVVAILQILDLLLELLHLMTQLFHRLGLSQNDLDELIRILPQPLQTRAQ